MLAVDHTLFSTFSGKSAYGWGTIDKYGAVTKASLMHTLGCFVFDDFALTTRGGTHKVTMEELKQFLNVSQRGSVHAFYGDAIFPEVMPRIWCLNYRSGEDRTHWFRREMHGGNTCGLVDLMDGELEPFNKQNANAEDIAIARRVIIFEVNEALFSQEAALEHISDRQSKTEEEEALGTPMPL